MIVLGAGLGLSFVPIIIAATNGVAAKESGLASGVLNTTQQVGGALGLAILSSVSTSRVTSALESGSPLPLALTHGFKIAFLVAARCAHWASSSPSCHYGGGRWRTSRSRRSRFRPRAVPAPRRWPPRACRSIRPKAE
jgi:hypothetical protein